MFEVNVTELRSHLPHYLSSLKKGAEIWVTSHGKVIARILSPGDIKKEALSHLKTLRSHCKMGDVISAIDEKWESEK